LLDGTQLSPVNAELQFEKEPDDGLANPDIILIVEESDMSGISLRANELISYKAAVIFPFIEFLYGVTLKLPS